MNRRDFAEFNAGVRRSLETLYLTPDELFRQFTNKIETPTETTRRLHALTDGVCAECERRESTGARMRRGP